MTVLILSGSDRYDSPWHDHVATSVRVGEILHDVDPDVRIRAAKPAAFEELDAADLAIANIGYGSPSSDDASLDGWAGALHTLDSFIRAGGGLLALHNSVGAFDEFPEWEQLLGGKWNRGVTMHPPIGNWKVSVHDVPEVTAGLDDFTVFDEMYTYLTVHESVHVTASHTYDGARRPLAWAGPHGAGRVAVDTLGHDLRSYDYPARVDFLARHVRWLLGPGQGRTP